MLFSFGRVVLCHFTILSFDFLILLHIAEWVHYFRHSPILHFPTHYCRSSLPHSLIYSLTPHTLTCSSFPHFLLITPSPIFSSSFLLSPHLLISPLIHHSIKPPLIHSPAVISFFLCFSFFLSFFFFFFFFTFFLHFSTCFRTFVYIIRFNLVLWLIC